MSVGLYVVSTTRRSTGHTNENTGVPADLRLQRVYIRFIKLARRPCGHAARPFLVPDHYFLVPQPVRVLAHRSYFNTYAPPCPRICLVMSSSHDAWRALLSAAHTCLTGPARTVLRCRPNLHLYGVVGDADEVPSLEGRAGLRVEIDTGSRVCRDSVRKGSGPPSCLEMLAVGRSFRGASRLRDVAAAVGCGGRLVADWPSVTPHGVFFGQARGRPCSAPCRWGPAGVKGDVPPVGPCVRGSAPYKRRPPSALRLQTELLARTPAPSHPPVFFPKLPVAAGRIWHPQLGVDHLTASPVGPLSPFLPPHYDVLGRCHLWGDGHSRRCRRGCRISCGSRWGGEASGFARHL